MPQPTVILLEDDPAQVSNFRACLERSFSQVGERPKLVTLDNESAFHEQICDLISMQPIMFVLDIMVRWRDIRHVPNILKPVPAPPNEAGIRCKNLIRMHDTKVPITIWTVIEPDTIPSSAHEGCELMKKSDQNMRMLIARIWD